MGGLTNELDDIIVRVKRAIDRARPARTPAGNAHNPLYEIIAEPKSVKHFIRAERSLDKKSVTLPHSGIKALQISRPLPACPEKESYCDKAWFHNLTREQAQNLIKEYGTHGNNSNDGYFLMRPSLSNPNNPLTLVLWFKDRVYNIPVRKRPDNRYALGTSKPDEQTFGSVEEIVPFYKKEKLILYTNGARSGSVSLLETPPREKNPKILLWE